MNRPVNVLGIGTALPENIASQEQAIAVARRLHPHSPELDRTLRALYRRTGVVTRHSVLDPSTGAPLEADPITTTAQRMAMFEAFAPPLGERSSRQALEAARLESREITHLVTVSCTGAAAPGIDIDLAERLALRRDVSRTHVGFMGCYGALAGMRVAAAYASDPDARVLLCAVELCTIHFHHGHDPEKMVANALFADGSGAAVLSAGPAPAGAFRVIGNGSFLIPDSREMMSWRIGDHGFEMSLSARVPERIEEHLRPWIEEWLGSLGTRLGDVQSFAVHPGGPRILSAVEKALGIGAEQTRVSREILESHGNMSSPTVLFILQRQRSLGLRGPTLALGFGPGLVAETALLG